MTSNNLDNKSYKMDFIERIKNNNMPIVIFDGAMGTSIQELNLGAEDFGGEVLEGCNENLVLTKPDSIKLVHKGFLDAGCDVIETNTFGASSIVLSEYGIQSKAFEINFSP